MATLTKAVCVLPLLLAGQALALPVFQDSAEEIGVGYVKGYMQVLLESDDPEVIYLFPAEFSGNIELGSFEIFWPLRGYLGAETLFRTRLDDGTYLFRFYVYPRLSLPSVVRLQKDIHERFSVGWPDCIWGDLQLDSLSAAHFESFSVSALAYETAESLPFQFVIPRGYIYGVSLRSSMPERVERALLQLGARGSVSISCEGYASAESPYVETFRHSIPVSLKLKSIEDREPPIAF